MSTGIAVRAEDDDMDETAIRAIGAVLIVFAVWAAASLRGIER